MSYTTVLIDRKGNTSPPFECEVCGDGAELEIDASTSYDYISKARSLYILENKKILSKHELHGYSFEGDTIIDGVNASRNGKYILILGGAAQ